MTLLSTAFTSSNFYTTLFCSFNSVYNKFILLLYCSFSAFNSAFSFSIYCNFNCYYFLCLSTLYSKSIQIEKDKLAEEYTNKLRRRRMKNSPEDSSDCESDSNKALAKRKNMYVTTNRPKRLANRLLFGFTFTVGVAAVAMYAMNHPAKEPQEMLAKIFQLLTYKDFI